MADHLMSSEGLRPPCSCTSRLNCLSRSLVPTSSVRQVYSLSVMRSVKGGKGGHHATGERECALGVQSTLGVQSCQSLHHLGARSWVLGRELAMLVRDLVLEALNDLCTIQECGAMWDDVHG